ncbi:MAG: hypothetical protein ABFR33_08315 [Verrucomicrobiota bacterium]
MKKIEQRYQGTVSRRFMLVGTVVTPILFIAVLSGVKLIQYGGVQADLRASREIWGTLEPRLAVASDQQHGLKTNRQAIDLINGWQDSQVSMEGLLLDIQKAIPENVQLTRISIRSEVKTSVYHDVDELELGYRLALQGISQGAQAENAVINLRKDLLDREYLSATFDAVKLTSLRKRAGQSGENMREFSLEGLGAESGGEK